MKLGVLTLPFNNNYGGYLQCYALMTILKQMGHEVELIYRRPNRRPLKYRLKIVIRNILRMLRNKDIASLIPDIEKELRYKGQNMMSFVDKHLSPRTLPLYTSKEFHECTENKYDAIVVGSDQIWRPEYVSSIRDFFLFGIKDKHVKRVAYAASFGVNNPIFNEEEKNDCGSAISKFSAVSLREEGGIDIIKRFGWKCNTLQVVLDPTLLLKREHYDSLLPRTKSMSYGKVCCYVLDWSEHKEQAVNRISHDTGLEILYILEPVQKDSPYYKMSSIEEWLSAIRDSAMVITDSYHGTVFSIIFQKPFIFMGNATRGDARIESLFDLLGIDSKNTTQINHDQVCNKITDLRKSSIDFIKSALG